MTDHAEHPASQDLGLVCIVRDAAGNERFRSTDLAECRIAADRLGVDATVEVYCVIYRATEASRSDPEWDLFNE